MALDALGDRDRALQLLADMQHLRGDDGRYWTGYVYADDVHWPVEHTTYTAAAVILAVDALARTHARQRHLPRRGPADWLRAPEPACGCERGSPTRWSRRAQSPSSATPQAGRSDPHRPDVGRSRRSRPRAPAGRRGTAAGRRRRVGEDVVDRQQPAVHHPRRPAGVVGLGGLLGVAAVDEQHRQRACARAAATVVDRPTTATTSSSRPASSRSCGGRPAACPSARPRGRPGSGRGAPSRPGSPPSRGGGRR